LGQVKASQAKNKPANQTHPIYGELALSQVGHKPYKVGLEQNRWKAQGTSSQSPVTFPIIEANLSIVGPVSLDPVTIVVGVSRK